MQDQLVELLQYDNFPLIKELMRNRTVVVWCQRLARSQNDSERSRIEVCLKDLWFRVQGSGLVHRLMARSQNDSERSRNKVCPWVQLSGCKVQGTRILGFGV